MKKIFKRTVVAIITWEARLVLKRYSPKIIAITGSVGKTSTKDAIYTVLADSFFTRKSDKSFNSEIGVPLTILGLKNGWSNPFIWIKNIFEGLLVIIFPHKYPEWLVLEVGADRPGDIKKAAAWLHPDITVITRFGDVPVHIEFFPSIDDLVEEKGHLARGLKESGLFIYNHDDKRIIKFADTVNVRKTSYGFQIDATVQATDEKIIYAPYENSEIEFPQGLQCTIMHDGSSMEISLKGALGRQHVYPLLAAVSAGLALKITPEKISAALSHHESPKGRMKLIMGMKDTLIIDDTYNSSPVAVEEGLMTLKKIKVLGRKIAVLGDMMELGHYSIEEHSKAGERAADSVDILVTVGVRSRGTAEAAQNAGMDEKNILQFETSREAGMYLSTIIKEGDILLVKGSQSMRMERVVEELMEHPENKGELLIRQDKEWQAKK